MSRGRPGGHGAALGRARLADRRPAPAAAAHDHRDRPGHLGQQPAPAARPGPAATTSSRELGETLDDLFGRLEASFQAQRHFVANASHELRTPLTAERTLLQVALADPDATAQTLRSTCEQVLELGEQQERLIEALLTLASSERGIEQREPFDLADIARTGRPGPRTGSRAPRASSVDAALAAAPAAGDPSLAESLVANLVDNAIRHNVPGGRVEISTGRGRRAGRHLGAATPAR